MARLRKKMQAAGTTGSAETSRPSLRDGFNGCFAFSPVRRAFWPPLPARRWKRRRKLNPSVGGSGPRDLTVRDDVVRRRTNSSLQRLHAHRIPLPTSVTIAIRPLRWRRDGRNDRSDLPDMASARRCDKLTRRAILRMASMRAHGSLRGRSGASRSDEPGIHGHRLEFGALTSAIWPHHIGLWLWIPGSCFARPGMTAERTARGLPRGQGARHRAGRPIRLLNDRPQNEVPPPNLNSCTTSYLPLVSGTA